jgi:hypothetical protein
MHNPYLTCRDLKTMLRINISEECIRLYLKKVGFKRRALWKVPYLKPEHIIRRFEWA